MAAGSKRGLPMTAWFMRLRFRLGIAVWDLALRGHPLPEPSPSPLTKPRLSDATSGLRRHNNAQTMRWGGTADVS